MQGLNGQKKTAGEKIDKKYILCESGVMYLNKMSNRTKNMFAETLKEMLKTTSLDKVRVKKLCEICGADRHTFYYHFKDIDDLVAWTYVRIVEENINPETGVLGIEGSAQPLVWMKKEAAFFRKALNNQSQNSLASSIYQYHIEMYEDLIRAKMQLENLPEEISFAIHYHIYGSLGMTIEWLNNDCPLSPEEINQRLISRMPEPLQTIVKAH